MLGRRGPDPLTAASPALLPPFSAPSAAGRAAESGGQPAPALRPPDDPRPPPLHLPGGRGEMPAPRGRRARSGCRAVTPGVAGGVRARRAGHPRGSGEHTDVPVTWVKGPNRAALEPGTSRGRFRISVFSSRNESHHTVGSGVPAPPGASCGAGGMGERGIGAGNRRALSVNPSRPGREL